MPDIDSAPPELRVAIKELWPEEEWTNAANISFLESTWNAFAVNDSTTDIIACGDYLRTVYGVAITAERSVGYFQINACSFPTWEWQRLYNARHNAGTAHMLWATRGWSPWYFSALALGLISV
jgi:hypothetical protein